ncbi:MAG: hypothetical protein EP330_00440 [Deltaproteobacteria bacterium]|nr:MAG: hypothetical protein EP330_00440 [Deltaproteobacteria bacterium]
MNVTVLAGSAGALLHASSLARAGREVRVLRVGALIGLGAAPVRDARDLAALRPILGAVGWVPRHARRELDLEGARRPLPDDVPGEPEHAESYVLPSRGWAAVGERAEDAVRAAGGDVVDVLLDEVEIEADRVSGLLSDCGFEWVDELHTDVHPDFLTRPATFPRFAEVDVVGDSALPWELVFTSGPVRRIVRDPVDPRRHRISLHPCERPRSMALEAVRSWIRVEAVGETRTGPVGDGEEALRIEWEARGVRWVPALW